MAQKHANLLSADNKSEPSTSQMSPSAITSSDVNTAQSVSQMLLMLAKSHPQNIGMGALIMATSLAAREMNIPMENIAAMFDRTIAEVYAVAGRTGFGNTVN